jgi:hypothetical protein
MTFCLFAFAMVTTWMVSANFRQRALARKPLFRAVFIKLLAQERGFGACTCITLIFMPVFASMQLHFGRSIKDNPRLE